MFAFQFVLRNKLHINMNEPMYMMSQLQKGELHFNVKMCNTFTQFDNRVQLAVELVPMNTLIQQL